MNQSAVPINFIAPRRWRELQSETEGKGLPLLIKDYLGFTPDLSDCKVSEFKYGSGNGMRVHNSADGTGFIVYDSNTDSEERTEEVVAAERRILAARLGVIPLHFQSGNLTLQTTQIFSYRGKKQNA